MSTDARRSEGDVLHKLEEERRARRRAVAEAEHVVRLAKALQRIAEAQPPRASSAEIFRALLEVFVDLARADVAVLRLVEDERLRSRASIGLDDEVAAGFSASVVDSFGGNAAHEKVSDISRVDSAAASCSEFMRKAGVHALYQLPLLDGADLVGVLYAGMLGDRELDDEARRLAAALGAPLATAVARCLAYEALEHAVRSRDEVLAVVAHDLRNPINVISIAANALLQRLPDSSARRPIERITRAAHRADRIVQDLLEISALEAGRFSIDASPVEATDMIQAAIESQYGPAAEASLVVSTEIAPDLPQIQADEERVLEVLENLIGNAVKFTAPGGSVTVGASARECDLLIWVKDSGSGIPPEQLPHIFDRFWQAKKKERRGTGLGLAICKAIVEAHGGRIWAESALAVGTTLLFTIPLATTHGHQGKESANILLVDDRPENLLSLQAILARPDYRLLTAASGEEAIGLALRESFAVALIDVAMPGMDGIEIAVRMKEHPRSREVPILFVTAFGDDPGIVHRAYSAGGADYLVKPLDAEIVRKKVAVFVELSRRRLGRSRVHRDRA